MNIRDLSRRSGVSLDALRKLERLGVLKVDAEDDRAAALRTLMSRNQPMSVPQMLALIETPALFEDLGKWEDRARERIAKLGNVADTIAPRNVAHHITPAAAGDADSLDALADYVQEALPAHDVLFHWLAVRIALAQFPAMRDDTVRAMNLAFAKLRGLDKMRGWWRNDGGIIIYRRPLDL